MPYVPNSGFQRFGELIQLAADRAVNDQITGTDKQTAN
jgi:hypothetical protein